MRHRLHQVALHVARIIMRALVERLEIRFGEVVTVALAFFVLGVWLGTEIYDGAWSQGNTKLAQPAVLLDPVDGGLLSAHVQWPHVMFPFEGIAQPIGACLSVCLFGRNLSGQADQVASPNRPSLRRRLPMRIRSSGKVFS